MVFYPDASSVKIDKVVLHYDSAVTTSATTTSVTTTTEAAKYTKVLTPKAEEDKGTDGKASNTKVEFDPMGAYKAIAYYTVKTACRRVKSGRARNSRIWPFRQTSRSLFPTTFRRLLATPYSSWFITRSSVM